MTLGCDQRRPSRETALEQAVGFSERISDDPFDLGDRAIFVIVSVGLAAIDDGTPGLEAVVRKADVAFYEAERSGRVGRTAPLPVG